MMVQPLYVLNRDRMIESVDDDLGLAPDTDAVTQVAAAEDSENVDSQHCARDAGIAAKARTVLVAKQAVMIHDR